MCKIFSCSFVLLNLLALASCAAEPCTVSDDGGGKHTMKCPDGTTTTWKDGDDGDNGGDGANGDNGSSCSATDNGDGSKTIACEDGTSIVIRDGDAVFGDLVGFVVRVDGGSLADIEVRLISTADGSEATALCDDNGLYTFLDIRAGVYTLAAQAEGLSPRRIENVAVADGVASAPVLRLSPAAFLGDISGRDLERVGEGRSCFFSDDGMLFYFDEQTGRRPVGAGLRFMRRSYDPRFHLVNARDGALFIYDIEADALVPAPDFYAFVPETALAVTRSGGSLRLFDLETGADVTVGTFTDGFQSQFFANASGLLFDEETGIGTQLVGYRPSDGHREALFDLGASYSQVESSASTTALRFGQLLVAVDMSTTPLTMSALSSSASNLLGLTDDGRYVYFVETDGTLRIGDVTTGASHDFGIGHSALTVAKAAPAFVSRQGGNVVHGRVDAGAPVSDTFLGSGTPYITDDGTRIVYRDGNTLHGRIAGQTAVTLQAFADLPTFVIDKTGADGIAYSTGDATFITFDLTTMTSVSSFFAPIAAPIPLARHILIDGGADGLYAFDSTDVITVSSFGFAAELVAVGDDGVLIGDNPYGGVSRVSYFDDATGQTVMVDDQAVQLLQPQNTDRDIELIRHTGDCAGCEDEGMLLFTDLEL